MATTLGRWTLALDGGEPPPRRLVGGKAWSIANMRALDLPVPPAFVVTTAACVDYLAHGRFPDGLDTELEAGIAWLEGAGGRRFGAGPRPLLVSVRSGAVVSMPGMMDTVLDLGMNEAVEAALALESASPAFAADTHRRFLEMYATVVLKAIPPTLDPEAGALAWRASLGREQVTVPDAPRQQLRDAVSAVFESWNSRRARRYRQHHGISDDLGTAVTVQAMVFGNLDDVSGSGVLFSRDPSTGEARPYGQYLPRAQGEDVVSGRHSPRPLSALEAQVPRAHEALLEAARRLERTAREVQDIEFTVERGRLYLLQARAAKRAPRAALRIAVDLVREGLIDEGEALRRVSPEQVRTLLAPCLDPGQPEPSPRLRGEAAGPGVGVGVVVADPDEAERRAHAGEAVVLARATTSPADLHGMIAARAIVTEQGGGTSHAAVVSRALGRPCVVGCGEGSTAGLAGREVTVDGGRGCVYDGALPLTVPDERDDPLCVALAGWAAVRTPLRVLRPAEAPSAGCVALDSVDGADDPGRIGDVLAGLRNARGAVGGAIASVEGVRGAIAAGLEFIVAEPVLPALLAAAQAAHPHHKESEDAR